MEHKHWVHCLSLNKPVGIYSYRRELKATVELIRSNVENGVMRMEVLINGGITAEIGMGEMILTTDVTLRAYAPIEFMAVPGSGYSPKVVYKLPKGYRVEPYHEEPVASLYDRARVHTFQEVRGV